MVRNPDLHLTISNPALFQLSERSYPGGRRPLCQTSLTYQVIQEQASPPLQPLRARSHKNHLANFGFRAVDGYIAACFTP